MVSSFFLTLTCSSEWLVVMEAKVAKVAKVMKAEAAVVRVAVVAAAAATEEVGEW